MLSIHHSSSNRFLNLLLVDDDEVDVLSVRRALEKGPVTGRMWVAGDGLEALALLRGAVFPAEHRLVLLDIHLPKMNGFELLKEMRRDPALRRVPVVILSSASEDREYIERSSLRVAGYLSKPVTVVSFIELVRALRRYGMQGAAL